MATIVDPAGPTQPLASASIPSVPPPASGAAAAVTSPVQMEHHGGLQLLQTLHLRFQSYAFYEAPPEAVLDKTVAEGGSVGAHTPAFVLREGLLRMLWDAGVLQRFVKPQQAARLVQAIGTTYRMPTIDMLT